jgi:hypothetical protein
LKARAYVDFKNQLHRIWSEPSEAIKRGIDFENVIYQMANRHSEIKASDFFHKICEIVKGGDFQKKANITMMIDEKEYYLYGKLDVYFHDLIIDIKTTSKFRGANSYLSTWQHLFYCLMTNIPRFMYLVVVFYKDIPNKIKSIEKVYYNMNEIGMDKVRKQIIIGIRDVIGFINSDKILKEGYYTKFNRS